MNAENRQPRPQATTSQNVIEAYKASIPDSWPFEPGSVLVPTGNDPVSVPLSTVLEPTPTEALTEVVGEDEGSSSAAGTSRRVVFNSETARKAALVRHANARKRKLERDKLVDESRFTARQRLGIALSELTLEDMRVLVKQLSTDAGKGDTKAIHALARLLDQSYGRAVPDSPAPPDGGDLAYSDMTEAQRASYRAALMAEREAAKAEAEPSMDVSDPRGDVPTAT